VAVGAVLIGLIESKTIVTRPLCNRLGKPLAFARRSSFYTRSSIEEANDDTPVRQDGSVSNDDDDEDAPEDEETSDREDEDDSEVDPPKLRSLIDPAIFRTLIPFQDLQRTVAAIDFGGIRAAQQAAAAFASQLPNLDSFQKKIQEQIAHSVNFSAIADLQRARARIEIPKIADQAKWAEGLAQAVNMSALQQANDLLASTKFSAIADAQSSIAAALSAHSEQWLKSFASINIARLLEGLDRWIADNLREVDDLEVVAEIALEDGIPLCWIPRTALVERFVAATTPEDRMEILDDCREDILADCDAALTAVPHLWARECADAISALRADLDGPGQSHAAGIVDSIVLCTLGPKNGRQVAKDRAVEDWEGLALRVAGESLALRPLYRALVTWWPGTGTPLPDHFARHATAHGIGQPGLFQRRHALIAVMLAVSLTVQFWDDPASADGLLPEDANDEGGDD